MDICAFDRIVSSLFDAIYDETAWSHFIRHLRASIPSDIGGLILQGYETGLSDYVMDGLNKSAVERFAQLSNNDIPWLKIPELLKPDIIVTDRSIDEHHHDGYFKSTAFYQLWLEPLGLRHCIGCIIRTSHHGYLILAMARAEKPYNGSDCESFALVSKQLGKAFHLAESYTPVNQLSQLSTTLLNHINIGVFILSENSAIEWANDYAEQFLQTPDFVRLNGNRLMGVVPRQDSQIQDMVRRCLNSRESEACRLTGISGKRVVFTVVPAQPGQMPFVQMLKRCALVLIIDHDNMPIDESFLRRCWSMTEKEALFTSYLLEGNSVNDCAEKMMISITTARWYAQQVMKKIGVSRQPDLIRKLSSSLFLKLPARQPKESTT